MLETAVRTDRVNPYRVWIAACAAAEAVGMTAAASAALLADRLSGLSALGVVVAGGLVEGTALGFAQGAVLARVAPRLSRARYLVATVVVAGLGWAAAAAPSTVSGGGDAQQPPMLVIALGFAGLGLVLGTLLGAAQAWALRGAVRHPWRWIGANAAAWPAAMALISLGATWPDAGWPVGGVLLLAVFTGLAAGVALGAVSGLFLPSLSGISVSSRAVLRLLGRSGTTRLGASLIGLEVRGRVSGRGLRLPVQYAVAPGGLAVLPGRPERKTWWRNVGTSPTAVGVLREGVWAPGTARRLKPGDAEYVDVLAAYLERWPDTPVVPDQPVVLLRLGAAARNP